MSLGRTGDADLGVPTGHTALAGLSTDEAQRRLRQHGPNAVKEESRRSWLVFLGKLWAPVPWMLEAAVALELLLGRGGEAIALFAMVCDRGGDRVPVAEEQMDRMIGNLLRLGVVIAPVAVLLAERAKSDAMRDIWKSSQS